MKENLYSGYHTPEATAPEVTTPQVKTEELSTVGITDPLESLGLPTSSDQIIEPIGIESKAFSFGPLTPLATLYQMHKTIEYARQLVLYQYNTLIGTYNIYDRLAFDSSAHQLIEFLGGGSLPTNDDKELIGAYDYDSEEDLSQFDEI